ncbi:hypothetical protein, partial [Parafilimonas sp.]|uniref:hypothetical protein n=1 Tax=Parafilimonas sp. TaxID=1969739 RepID=UPI0039E30DFB
MKPRFILFLLIILNKALLSAQPITISDSNNIVFISNNIEYIIDTNKNTQYAGLMDSNFLHFQKGTPVFSENVKNVWAKFSII